MSGGSLLYFFSVLQEHVGDFGDKELDELVKDLATGKNAGTGKKGEDFLPNPLLLQQGGV